jgi:hypothetical protein
VISIELIKFYCVVGLVIVILMWIDGRATARWNRKQDKLIKRARLGCDAERDRATERKAMITLQDIQKLPRRQRNALGQICAGDDSCLHPKTLESLERKGFVRSFSQRMGNGI